jgi:RNA polymerase sigma factor (sigma-70 family)
VITPWYRRCPHLWPEILDAAHDGLVMAAQAWTPGKHTFATYALNKARWSVAIMLRNLSYRRKRPVPIRLNEDWDQGLPWTPPDRSLDDADAFDAILDRVTPKQADVLRLAYEQSMTQAEIARELAISQAAVNFRSQAGLATLQRHLDT